MALIRHKTTGAEESVPDAKAALPYFPDYEEVDPSEASAEDKSSGETAKTSRSRA